MQINLLNCGGRAFESDQTDRLDISDAYDILYLSKQQ